MFFYKNILHKLFLFTNRIILNLIFISFFIVTFSSNKTGHLPKISFRKMSLRYKIIKLFFEYKYILSRTMLYHTLYICCIFAVLCTSKVYQSLDFPSLIYPSSSLSGILLEFNYTPTNFFVLL